MPATAPFWNDDPESWDTVIVSGVRLPGLARIEGLELASKWDVKEAPGTDGATETYQGYTPASFQIVLRIWDRAQWVEWLALAPRFRPRPGRSSPDPVDVVHPDLAIWGISRAIIRKLKPKKIDDFYDVAFDMLEFFPQPKKTAASTSSATKSFWNALDGSKPAAGSGGTRRDGSPAALPTKPSSKLARP
ncbi:MAG: hypothetical protein HYV09_24775 [Deltaproteobacteria bacterium]|nr:hypothetical protein [Deltaproteobacteria bacterium]